MLDFLFFEVNTLPPRATGQARRERVNTLVVAVILAVRTASNAR